MRARFTNNVSRLVLATAWLLCTTITAGEATEPSARDILNETGIKGGLIVHIGCGDGKLTAALRANDSLLVHGLDTDAKNVEKAREHIKSLGLYGKVSIGRLTGNKLPYIDNLVNLIVAENPGNVSMEEIKRVLCPNGAAYIKSDKTTMTKDRGWVIVRKPVPPELDEWTHFLHDAGNNAVSGDKKIGHPKHMQWQTSPQWSRFHHMLASVSAVVSADGRLFYVCDQGPGANMDVPAEWSIVARDAYNSTFLWRQPIKSWANHQRKFRSGPVQLPRLLVTDGKCVYLPLEINSPVAGLDCVTGEIVRTYAGSEGAEELILNNGILLVVTGTPFPEQSVGLHYNLSGKFPDTKSIIAYEATSGRQLWKSQKMESSQLVPCTLAANENQVFYQLGNAVVSCDLKSGKELWNTNTNPALNDKEPQKGKGSRKKPKPGSRGVGWAVSTLVIKDGVALLASGGKLSAYSAKDGKQLWENTSKAGFKSASDLFVINSLVWTNPFSEGYDLRTGEVRKQLNILGAIQTAGHHHRCYREKASERYIMCSHRGIEFMDLEGDNHARHNWVRGVCQYGIMPSNGLIYAPPHSCGCYMEAKLWGFWALAAERQSWEIDSDNALLEKGPAYGQIEIYPQGNRQLKIENSPDWPTLRYDSSRSGHTTLALPTKLSKAWQTKIGGNLSAPVCAGGLVLLTNIDGHTVHALNAKNGEKKWSYTAGGRIDSPPTIFKSLALFGSRDGWVYCLSLAKGKLLWRFRAAPADMKTIAMDQLESLWPVNGSILVQNGVAYFAAGRNSYLDDGIFLYGLDPQTGKVLYRNRIAGESPRIFNAEEAEQYKSRHELRKIQQNATDYRTFISPDKSDAFSMAGGATTDVLVGDGKYVYLRHLCFNQKLESVKETPLHLFSTSSLLDGNENHRSHWTIGTGNFSRIGVAYSWIVDRTGPKLWIPIGLMFAFDNKTAWGVRRAYKPHSYSLFAKNIPAYSPDKPIYNDLTDASKTEYENKWFWETSLPLRPRAILKAGEYIYLVGMPNTPEENEAHRAFEGFKGGLLTIFSSEDGREVSQINLGSPPVWDGIAAANKKLYICTMDSTLVCLK